MSRLCILGLVTLGAAASCVLAGCGEKAAPPPPPPPVQRAPAPSLSEVWTAEEIAFVQEKFGKLEVTGTGLRYKILQPGEGDATPARANLVTVNYQGSFLNGHVFDRSREGAPARFRIGVGQLIKGWDEAIMTMKKGEKRLLVVPYWLGYGVKGKVPYIMPRTTLVFEIELLGWETTTRAPLSSG